MCFSFDNNLLKTKVMKKLFLFTIALFISGTYISAQTKAGREDTTKHFTIYSCLMHPEVAGAKGSACPKCRMELTLSGKEKMKASLSNDYNCPVHINEASHDPAKCPKCGRSMNLSLKEQMKAEVTKLYNCPMHPQISLDKDGNCHKCATALAERKKS